MNVFVKAVRWVQSFFEGTHEVHSFEEFSLEMQRNKPAAITVIPRPARTSWFPPRLHRSFSLRFEAVYPGSYQVHYRLQGSRFREYTSEQHDEEGEMGDFYCFVFDQMDKVRQLSIALRDVPFRYYYAHRFHGIDEFEELWGVETRQRIDRVMTLV